MKNKLHSRSGIALVIVLGFLTILSGLAVAFFVTITSELKSARTFASGASTRQLADSAVNVVMSQISDATTRENAVWASQPGMLRVYRDPDTKKPSAKAEAFLKLYSSDKMVLQGAEMSAFIVQDDYVVNWEQKPAFWTDLNAPVVVRNPRTTLNETHFPVIDPRAKGVVTGFDFETDRVHGTVAAGGDTDRLPMPVRWIYVLQDGTLTVPTAGDGAVARWLLTTDGKMPSKTNPIVGRIAFWTDDDSNKVNINTAAGFVNNPDNVPTDYKGDPNSYFGSFWDTPRFYTNFDHGVADSVGMPKAGGPNGGLALTQLLQGEYQRYPGHPATTSLGPIFGAYLSSHDLWRILPRISTANYDGIAATSASASTVVNPYSYGTDGGTKRVKVGPSGSGGGMDNQNLLPKTERLYASVDELLFANNPDHAGGFDPTSTSYQRQSNDAHLNLSAPSKLTPERLNKLRFFLTAHSRAPELNLFGRPRVAVWPVRSETNSETSNIANTGLNPYDKVMLFCSTIGPVNSGTSVATSDQAPGTATAQLPYRYIFTRRNPLLARSTGTTVDKVADIYLPRNNWLLKTYLSAFTQQPIPGFGASLQSKWDSDGNSNRDQLLAEIFDYIRCANCIDTTTIQWTPSPVQNRKFASQGVIVPSKIELHDPKVTQSGMGRFPCISEVTLVFYYAGPTRDGAGKVERGSVVGYANRPKYRQMRAFLFFSTFNPMQGYGPMGAPGSGDPRIWIKVEGLDQLKVSASGMVGPSGGLNFPSTGITGVNSYGGIGGYEGFFHTLVKGSGKEKTQVEPLVDLGAPMGNGSPQEYYPFQTPLFPYSSTVDSKVGLLIPTTTEQFTFTGNKDDITVSIYFDTAVTDTTVPLQKLKLKFPNGTNWPVPKGDEIDNIGNADSGVNFNVTDPVSGTPKRANDNLGLFYWGGNGSFYPGGLRGAGGSKPVPPYEATQVKPYRHDYFSDDAGQNLIPNLWTCLQGAWSFASRLAWAERASDDPARTPPSDGKRAVFWAGNRWRQIMQPGDTIRSLVYCDTPSDNAGGTTSSGDLRLSLVTNVVQEFKPHPDWDDTSPSGSNRACQLKTFFGDLKLGNQIKLDSGKEFPADKAFWNLPRSLHGKGWVNGVTRSDGGPGDFDTGIGSFPDGPFGNKQDEGNVIYARWDSYNSVWVYPIPYYATGAYTQPGNTFTSPLRQMPSPVMMGSLPARAASLKGWETLCFTPYPASPKHPGNTDPKDHLLLDLFSMPVVEPYPISEPFSTAGKINMNYRIEPFNYITRTTGLRAALAPIRITAVPSVDYLKYKSGDSNGMLTTNYRRALDCNDITNPTGPSLTLQKFEAFFDEGKTNPDLGMFKSASQICEMPLVPVGTTDVDDLWGNCVLTGDNVREKPYADLYPRLTTKSNTYTVHFRVQTLRQVVRDTSAGAGAYAVWEEGKDYILGEYRGATTIERYIDPADLRFNKWIGTAANNDYINPDSTLYDSSQEPATSTSPSNPTRTLELVYRFRTLINKKFAP